MEEINQPKYGAKEIRNFANALLNSEDAYQALVADGFPELAALTDAFIQKDFDAVRYLHRTGHKNLLAFYLALERREYQSYNYLMGNYEELSSVIDAIIGVEKSFDWIKSNYDEEYVLLVSTFRTLYYWDRKKYKRNWFSQSHGIGHY